ncbi:MAG TPA: metal-sulfur cluster assembly factor, partial [Solirubrobacteraceae bacterium]|nr:metal-sulfur cluster assembly factor [Solirubrobacteraceae bacterium]
MLFGGVSSEHPAPEPGGRVAHAPGLDLLADAPSADTVAALLRDVIDPELGLDIVSLGLLRSAQVDAGVARVRFTVTTPACPLSSYIEDQIRACLWQLPGLREIDVACELEPAWRPEDMSEEA